MVIQRLNICKSCALIPVYVVEVGEAEEEREGQREKDQGRAEFQNSIKDSKMIPINQCLEIYLTRGMKCL